MSNSLDPDQDRHSVCKDYQQTTKVAADKEIVKRNWDVQVPVGKNEKRQEKEYL